MILHKVRISFDPALCWMLAAFLLTVPARFLFGWILAVCVHEFGHFLALSICKARVLSVRFGLKGALMQTRQLTNAETLFCAAAGPVAGILLILGAKYHPVTSVCGFLQSIYNLIPVPGHDGDKLLQSLCRLILSEAAAAAVHKWIRFLILFVVSIAVICFLFL